MSFDIMKNLAASLQGTYNWGPRDMTTLLARKLAQDRQTESVSDPALYDGDDLTDETRVFLNGLTTI